MSTKEERYKIVSAIVDYNLAQAESATRTMIFDTIEKGEKRASARFNEHGMVSELPAFRFLKLAQGAQAWSAILFVDLRGSTARAKSVGAKKTYLTMHALIPALAYAVQEYGGYIVGFRGDGLFGAFGLTETGFNPQNYDQGEIVREVCKCGKFMIEAVDAVVNKALQKRQCVGNLRIGVGIDSGTIIMTRIGVWNADEVTAYGDAVNGASKICALSNNDVLVSKVIREKFPKSEGGTTRFEPHPEDDNVRRVILSKPQLAQSG